MKSIKIYIYTLSDPETKEIRYVGKTNNLKSRYNNHISHNIKTHCCNWIKSLKKRNLLPIMEVIEKANDDNWVEREQFWISQFNNLTNQTIGGEGLCGIKASDETKELMSKNRIGKFTNKLSEEDVLEIRKLLLEGYSTSNLAKKYNVSKSAIQHIRENKTWKHLGEFKVIEKASSISPDIIKRLFELFNEKTLGKDIRKELGLSTFTIAKQRKIWKLQNLK